MKSNETIRDDISLFFRSFRFKSLHIISLDFTKFRLEVPHIAADYQRLICFLGDRGPQKGTPPDFENRHKDPVLSYKNQIWTLNHHYNKKEAQ